MPLDTRKQMILDLLSEKKEISLSDLGKSLHYSAATIRRDVTQLEQAHFLKRSYGKIHWVESIDNDVPAVNDRQLLNSYNKHLIAKCAKNLVSDGQTVILDSGTTTNLLAQELLSNRLMLVINSIEIALTLATSNSQVISCGGLLQPTHMCFVGPDAEHFFSQIEAETLFLGTSGVRSTLGLTTSSPLQLNVKQAMIHAAKKRIVLFDLSKFSVARLFMFSDFSDIDTIVTTHPSKGSMEEKYLTDIGRKGVEIIYADEHE